MCPRIEYPYECQVKGHNSGNRIFTSAPPDWFANKGLSIPRNCPGCREWIKSQVDEVFLCSCGSPIGVSATKKISHFKHTGPYVPITRCAVCERSSARAEKTSTTHLPDYERIKENDDEKNVMTFGSLAIQSPAQARKVVTDLQSYVEETHVPCEAGGSERRDIHLAHHIPGSPHSWVELRVAESLGIYRPKSATSFVGHGQSVQSLLNSVASHAVSTSSSNVREYRDGDRRIVRITFTGDHNALEMTVLQLEDSSDAYRVITSYDSVTLAYVKSRGWYSN